MLKWVAQRDTATAATHHNGCPTVQNTAHVQLGINLTKPARCTILSLESVQQYEGYLGIAAVEITCEK